MSVAPKGAIDRYFVLFCVFCVSFQVGLKDNQKESHYLLCSPILETILVVSHPSHDPQAPKQSLVTARHRADRTR